MRNEEPLFLQAAKWAYWDLKLIDRLRPVWQRHIVAAAAGLNLAVLACLGLVCIP